MLNSIHGLYAVEFGSTPHVVVGGVTQENISSGSRVEGEPADSEVYSRFLALIEQKPVARFTTRALAQALAQCGASGLDLDGLADGLILYARAHADGGGRAAGAAHVKYVVKDGLLIPRRLSAEHRQDAQVEYEALVTWDGANDPLTIAVDQSLPSGATGLTERFTMGPVTIGNLTLDHVRRVEIDFGITARPESADSTIWDTFVSIEQALGVVRIMGVNPKWFGAAAVPLTGKTIAHADTAIYFRKRAAAGYVADETAEHVKLTVAGQGVIDDVFDASGNRTGETGIMIPLLHDGTNDPIVIDTASAIA